MRQDLTQAVFEEAKEAEIREIAAGIGKTIGDIAVIKSSGYALLSDILDEEQLDMIAEFHENRLKRESFLRKRMKQQRNEHGQVQQRSRREQEEQPQSQKNRRRQEDGQDQRRGRQDEGDRPGPGRMFEKRDANKDGKLTPDEMGGNERSQRFFDKFDSNEDGAVTLEEFNEKMPQQPQRNGEKPRRK